MKRTLIAATAALSILTAACSDGAGVGSSKTQIVLTDAPFPSGDVAHVNLYIGHVDASTTADTIPGGQQWVTVARPERAFDLLQLQRGSTALLGDVDLPAGQYRAIRMTIDPSKSSVMLNDGTTANVHWPYAGPDGLSTLYAIVEEPLVPGPGAKIVIDFDVGRSFIVLESMPRQFVLIPWLRSVNDAATGHISGQVHVGGTIEGGGAPAAGAAVTVFRGNPQLSPATWSVAATGRVDAEGKYAINYLRDGSYIVRFEENVGLLAVVPGCLDFTSVPVNRRATTTLNAVISHLTDLCAAHSPSDTSGHGPDTTVVSPGGPVANVTIHAWMPPHALVVGDSIPVVAELRNAAGGVLSGRLVTWSVRDTTVARLEGVFGQYAYLRVKQGGTAVLSATSEGLTGTYAISIAGSTGGGTGAVSTVQIVMVSANHRIADSVVARAELRDATGALLTGRTLSWSVRDSTIVQLYYMFGDHVVGRAVRPGGTLLMAESEGKAASVMVYVVADTSSSGTGPVATVTLTPAALGPAAVRDTLGAYAALANAAGGPITGRAVTFSVSDSTVARITFIAGQTVTLLADKVGTATLTATSEGKTGTATITVR